MICWADNPMGPSAQWLCHRIGYEPSRNFRVFSRLSFDYTILGAVGFDGFNGASCMMHCAGRNSHWLSLDLLRMSFDYPFNACSLKCVLALVPSGNKEALRLNEHVGFRTILELKDAHPDGSLLLMRMDKEGCKWAQKPRRQDLLLESQLIISQTSGHRLPHELPQQEALH